MGSKLVYFLITFLASTLFGTSIWGQELHSCGHQLSPEQIDLYKRISLRRQNKQGQLTLRASDGPILYFMVNNIIVRRADSTGGLSLRRLEQFMDELNLRFEETGIQFISCEPVYVYDDSLYEFHIDEEDQLIPFDNPEAINVYYFNSVRTDTVNIGGYAYFPPDNPRNIVVMNRGAGLSTLPHELGHFFFLGHTHGPDNNTLTEELVDGSNCSTTGDFFCDTPADPNLSNDIVSISGTCVYSVDMDTMLVDANGDEYMPDTRNIMSYSRSSCRDFFSDEQLERIRTSALEDKNNLIIPDSNLIFASDYTIANNVSPDEMFPPNQPHSFVSVKIEASNQITDNSNIRYVAHKGIHLFPGFGVERGSAFQAKIGFECENYSLPPTAAIANYLKYKDKDPSDLKIPLTDLELNQLQIFPNPNKGVFQINIPANAGALSIISGDGKRVYESIIKHNGTIALPPDLKSGIYFVLFRSDNQVFYRKILINK